MKAEELPHSLAMGATTGDPLHTGGEMADEELEAPAGREFAAGSLALVGLYVAWPHTGAPFRAYVN